MTAPSTRPEPTPLAHALTGAGVTLHQTPRPEWMLNDLGLEKTPPTAFPRTEEEFVITLREAARLGVGVVPIGGGRGLAPVDGLRDVALLLSFEKWTGVLEHSAADYVVTVRSGTRLAELQSTLAPDRQWLALEPPDPEQATIGGLIASAATSALEASEGTLRASLLGCRVLHTDGHITKAGGKVVKNVSGYDLMKLYHGSRGGLVTLLDATFRLKPHAACDRVSSLEIAGALERWPPHLLRDAIPADPAGVHLWGVLGDDGPQGLAIRFQGARAAVDTLQSAVRAHVDVELITEDVPTPGRGRRPAALERITGLLSRGEDPDAVHLEAKLPLSSAAAAHARLQQWAHKGECRGEFLLDGGTGRWWLKFPGSSTPSSAALVSLRDCVRGLGGWLQLHAVPRRLRLEARSPGVDAARSALTRQIKERFDPAGVLSPGRWEGGS